MQWKRLVRSVCCLLVVCVLLFNIVTLPVQATAVAVTVATVAAALVVGAVFIGLGAMPAASPAKFETAVNDCVADLTLKGLIADGIVHVAKIGTGVKAVQAVGQDFLEAVREWLFGKVFSVSHVYGTYVPTEYYCAYDDNTAKSYITYNNLLSSSGGFSPVSTFSGVVDFDSGALFFDTSFKTNHAGVFCSEPFSLQAGEYAIPDLFASLYGLKACSGSASSACNFSCALVRINADGSFSVLSHIGKSKTVLIVCSSNKVRKTRQNSHTKISTSSSRKFSRHMG